MVIIAAALIIVTTTEIGEKWSESLGVDNVEWQHDYDWKPQDVDDHIRQSQERINEEIRQSRERFDSIIQK